MRASLCAALIAACALAAGCSGETSPRWAYDVRTGGDAHRGLDTIYGAGCGSCHTIPGVRGANGMVGPPLTGWARRTYIAGELPNTPDNLVRWIADPSSIEPHTAMPILGLDPQQTRDVAAFLYTLR